MQEFFLTIQVCSLLIGCYPSFTHPVAFGTHNQCAIQGYKISLQTHKELIKNFGEDRSDKLRIAVKFWCEAKTKEQKKGKDI